MRLGITAKHLDCAHLLPGHPKCGRLHGHTYRSRSSSNGEANGRHDPRLADLKVRFARCSHRLRPPALERLPGLPDGREHLPAAGARAGEKLSLPFSLRVYEGHGKVGRDGRAAAAASRGGDPGMMRIDEVLRRRTCVPAVARMWTLSARKIEGLEERWNPRSARRCSPCVPLHGARLKPTGRRAFQFGSACCSSTPPASATSCTMGRERTVFAHGPARDPHGRFTTMASTTSAPGAPAPADARAGASSPRAASASVRAGAQASGAVQARRWTRTATAAAFIYSFNGPHSLSPTPCARCAC